MPERPLTTDERAALADRLTRARHESRTALVKTALSSLLVCGVLAVLTRLASDAPTSVKFDDRILSELWPPAVGAHLIW